MPFKAYADRRYRIPKQRRRVTNWAEYDAALRQRGSLTVWFTREAIAAWHAEPRTTPGGQPHDSDLAILTALTLKAVFRLALRQTEGLIGSVIHLLGLALSVPDHTTLSRRAETLEGPRPRSDSKAEPVHLLVDSTGLRVCPGSFCCVRELSEHQANGSQVQEGESLAAEALPVLGQPTAAVQPSYGAFDDPALRQDREALGLIGPLDDLHPDAAADASQTRLELRPLIAAVGVKLEQKRRQPEEGGHDHHATVTVLHVGGMHEGVHQQALGVDQDMALLPLDLLARVVARRVD